LRLGCLSLYLLDLLCHRSLFLRLRYGSLVNLAMPVRSTSSKGRSPIERAGKQICVVDLFCGAGGLTCGFDQAGLDVRVGVDTDSTCQFPFEHNNPGSRFILKDVASLTSSEVASWFPPRAIRILAGCAPCQPFSKYTVRRGKDERWRLLYDFLRLVCEIRPDVVSMENVVTLKRGQYVAYLDFLEGLEKAGYGIREYLVNCADYGVPQTRQRLVLLAGAHRTNIDIIAPAACRTPTVYSAIGGLPPIKGGGLPAPTDPLHVASSLSAINLKRIRATPEGGSWHDWPPRLRLECHKRIAGRYYKSVYGRMAWHEPAPTITTQCYGYGNGRFGHPEQDRAISLREAAILQSFPDTYVFVPAGERPTFRHVGRQIGNAVPVALARTIGASIRRSITGATTDP
jgi:DNA (cytosine-5)-methyltransferase 1